MDIVFAASESVPFVKAGGLAEVIGALPREVARQGHKVTVYLPFYREVQAKVKERKVAISSLTAPFDYYNRFSSVLDGGVSDGVQFYFIDCPELFDREYMYGTPSGDYADNWERYGLFCRAVLEASKQLGVPDIFHSHEWHAAMLPVFLRTIYYFDPALRKTGVVLTVHNTSYQGLFPSSTIERLLLPWDVYTSERLEHYGQVDILKGGIVYSDIITTVSKKYAEEVQTPEYGNGLDPVFRKRVSDLHGILNGADYSRWDPATDGNIAAHYTADNLAGKAQCRRDLLHAFGLRPAGDTTPVLGMVSRLATQKGVDLLGRIMEELAQEDVRVVILGVGEPYYENAYRSFAERHPEKIGVRIAFDTALAHKIQAGSDILLIPSRFEPCGLNQFYSVRYGTVPVARATGGLDDAIKEWEPSTGEGTGFKFQGLEPSALLETIRRAAEVFRTDKPAWEKLMRNGMAEDHSWTKPAAEYIELYRQVARRRS